MEIEHNDIIEGQLVLEQIDLTQTDNIIQDSEKFKEKLLQNGIIDKLFLNFLNDLEDSGKNEEDSINNAQQFFNGEIERVKQNYELRIEQIRQESESILKQYEINIEQLQQRCQELEDKNHELENMQSSNETASRSLGRGFLRRNSENARVFDHKVNNSFSKNRFDNKIKHESNIKQQKDPQYIEDENIKLKKQLEEQNEKYDRSLKKWETKFTTQKKTIDELRVEC